MLTARRVNATTARQMLIGNQKSASGVIVGPEVAAEMATDPFVRAELLALAEAFRSLSAQTSVSDGMPATGDEWTVMIAPGATAMHAHAKSGLIEVTVKGYRYTPRGLLYELEPLRPSVARGADGAVVAVSQGKWLVPAGSLQAINGQTRLIRVNLLTGDDESDAPEDPAA